MREIFEKEKEMKNRMIGAVLGNMPLAIAIIAVAVGVASLAQAWDAVPAPVKQKTKKVFRRGRKILVEKI